MNLQTHQYQDWDKSQYMADVRESFRKNLRHPGCVLCWQQEDQGHTSLRQRSLGEYRRLGAEEFVIGLLDAEIQVGNLCNLSCLMCTETASSAILAENRRLNISLIDQRDYLWNDRHFTNLSNLLDLNLRSLSIRGGEPVYNKDLYSVLSKIPDEQKRSMMLHVVTNATKWNQDWADLCDQFGLVRIMASVDAVGLAYEYMRYPGVWEETQRNLLSIRDHSKCRLILHCVIQNLNILHLGDLIDWCQRANIEFQFDIIPAPRCMQITNVPDKIKKLALEHMDKILERNLSAHAKRDIQAVRDSLASSEFDPGLWQEFKNRVMPRDRLRGKDYRSLIPSPL